MAEDAKKEVVNTVDTTPAEQDAEKDTGAKDTKPNFSDEQQKYIDGLISKQYKKLQTKADEKLKQLEQAEKLKSMSEVERAKEELRIANEKLTEYENEKLVNQFKVELTTKGLKSDFAKFIPVQDADKAKQAVDFLSSYKAEIEKGYTDKIKDLEEQVRKLSLRGNVPTGTKNTSSAPKSTPKIF